MLKILLLFAFMFACTSTKPMTGLVGEHESTKNIFVYGTLALPEKQKELGLKCRSEIPYDYIKGYALKEIQDVDSGTYLCAYPDSNGIISGRVLLDCNFDQSLKNLDEWEGESYSRYLITTSVKQVKAMFYAGR